MINIISVCYNGADDLKGLLASLQRQSSPDWKLWIVDNGDADEEWSKIEEVVSLDSRARGVRAPGNLGYLGAPRWLIQNNPGLTSEWVAVCNTDLRVASEDLVARIAGGHFQEAGVIAPRITSLKTGRDQNPYMTARPSVASMKRRAWMFKYPWRGQLSILCSTVLSHLRPAGIVSRDSDSSQIYAPHGSFMIFSPLYFERGGTLEHPVFLFGEEITVAEQCHDAGLSVVYRPDLHIEHVAHGQMGILRSRTVLQYSAEATRYAYQVIAGN